MTTPSSSLPTNAASADQRASARTFARSRHFWIWVVGVAVVSILLGALIYVPELYVQSTDDAYIQADVTTVAPKVAGYVTTLKITDNSHFKAGDLLLELDPREFRVALETARAGLEVAKAAKANALQRLAAHDSAISAAKATLAGDRAHADFFREQYQRYTNLAKSGAVSSERAQQASSDLAIRNSELERDLALLANTQAQVKILQSNVEQAEAEVAKQAVEVKQAELNLTYSKIYAGSDGTIANKMVQVGNFVQPGQTLFSTVPNEVYVIANFKETQLKRLKVGQKVSVRVDALGGREIEGRIDSFQRGTGSNFALLPPENATGNFIKVVQRIPVKIVFGTTVPELSALSPGMSVEVSVNLR